MEIIEIIDSLKDAMPNWVWMLVSSGVAAIITIYSRSEMSKDFFGTLIKLYHRVRKSKKGGKKGNMSLLPSDIVNHDLFNYIDFWLYNQIPSIILKTKYRTVVFRKYLHFYFKAYKDVIQDFVDSDEYKTMTPILLKKKLLGLITSTTIKMESDMREHKIPEIVIIKMKNVMNNRINLTRDLIEQISDSTFYDTEKNLLKIYSFLNIVHSILDNTISNIEPVCNSINGELGGLTLDGYTEPLS